MLNFILGIKNKYDQKQLSRSANFPGTPTKNADGTGAEEKRRIPLPHKVRKRKTGVLHAATGSHKQFLIDNGNKFKICF